MLRVNSARRDESSAEAARETSNPRTVVEEVSRGASRAGRPGPRPSPQGRARGPRRGRATKRLRSSRPRMSRDTRPHTTGRHTAALQVAAPCGPPRARGGRRSRSAPESRRQFRVSPHDRTSSAAVVCDTRARAPAFVAEQRSRRSLAAMRGSLARSRCRQSSCRRSAVRRLVHVAVRVARCVAGL
jgi:hypothetical protein